jgi:hypothetical protein
MYAFGVHMSENFGLFLDVAGVLLIGAIFLGAIGYGSYLAAKDAERRGKSPVLVWIACVLFFPWGLVAWLIFRPDPIDKGKDEFELEDFRVQ